MAAEVIMPALGMAQERGRLIRWLKAPGDQVVAGEPLLEIETDKAAVEIAASASGTLAGVVVGDDHEVPVGAHLGWILAADENLPDSSSAPVAVAGQEPPSASAAGILPSPGDHASARVAASPLARRLAQERGLELLPGRGSGPEGAYLEVDVRQELPQPTPGSAERASDPQLRRRMAAHTAEVWSSSPHFYLSREVGARGLRDWLSGLRRRGLAPAPTYTDLLALAAGEALVRSPQMLRYWQGDQLLVHPRAVVGIAVASGRGLVLVSLGETARAKGVEELARRREAALERAETGRLLESDLTGPAITISNLGMYAVDSFHAVLSAGQSGVLAVGRLADRPVARDDRVVVEPTMSLTLTCDHRVVDGAEAAGFLGELVELLEAPALLREASIGPVAKSDSTEGRQ